MRDSRHFKTDNRNRDMRPALAFIQLDNMEDVLKAMPVEARPHLVGTVEKVLVEWAGDLEGYLETLQEGRYVVFCAARLLLEAEKSGFTILDRVRELKGGNERPITLSIGIGMQEENVGRLGRMAHNSLELALERGGDQVVVKSPYRTKFYGGKSMSIEKKTKVKARVMATALRNMLLEASRVVVMGHAMADYDSLGAAIGIACAAESFGKETRIIADERNPAVKRLQASLYGEKEGLKLVKPGSSNVRTGDNTLLVVVDTNKPSLLADKELLQRADQVAVIDHHRRGAVGIEKARLFYVESYASSTCELVTELLQYYGDQVELGRNEAIALLAGITVDTKNFMLQTGVRTFEAAAFLRGVGADPAVVRDLISEEISAVIKKAEVISRARILYGHIALAVGRDTSDEAQTLAAKAADTMLDIKDVYASFVLWPYEGGSVVSARSHGEINVQSILEKMGGGGHMTVAAAQIKEPPNIVEKRLLKVLEKEFR